MSNSSGQSPRRLFLVWSAALCLLAIGTAVILLTSESRDGHGRFIELKARKVWSKNAPLRVRVVRTQLHMLSSYKLKFTWMPSEYVAHELSFGGSPTFARPPHWRSEPELMVYPPTFAEDQQGLLMRVSVSGEQRHRVKPVVIELGTTLCDCDTQELLRRNEIQFINASNDFVDNFTARVLMFSHAVSIQVCGPWGDLGNDMGAGCRVDVFNGDRVIATGRFYYHKDVFGDPCRYPVSLEIVSPGDMHRDLASDSDVRVRVRTDHEMVLHDNAHDRFIDFDITLDRSRITFEVMD